MVKRTSPARRGYLIWDFDGTLAFRPGGWTGALLQVLQESKPDLPVKPEQIRAYLQSGFPWHAPENPHPGISPDEWWEDLTPVFIRAFRVCSVTNDDAHVLAHQVRTVYTDPQSWQRFPDTLPALEILATRGWKHILLSNHTPELANILDHLKLTSYFAVVFNSGITGYEKPNLKAFRAVLDWMGPDAAAWMIGDSYPTDIAGAQQVHLPGILVRNPNPLAKIYCETLKDISEKLDGQTAASVT